MTDLYIFLGMGLISGSMAIDLKHQYAQKSKQLTIVGLDVSEQSLIRAQEKNIIDASFAINPDSSFEGYSLLRSEYLTIEQIEKHKIKKIIAIIATPVGAFENIFKNLAALNLDPKVVPYLTISDVGSTKSVIVDKANMYLGPLKKCFVPAHPIAGREKSGVDAAIANLYVDKWCFLIDDLNQKPQNKSELQEYQERIQTITNMWQGIGAKTTQTPADMHDHLFAELSHVPHFLAFAAAHTCHNLGLLERAHQSNASDKFVQILKTFLRIASADPTMWADIARDNQQNILMIIEQFKNQLNRFNLLNLQIKKNNDIDDLISSNTYHTKIGTQNQQASHPYQKMMEEMHPNMDLLFLPLIIAHAYLQSIVKTVEGANKLVYAGSGLRDFTGIFNQNQNQNQNKQKSVAQAQYDFLSSDQFKDIFDKYLQDYQSELCKVEKYIKENDRAALLNYIAHSLKLDD